MIISAQESDFETSEELVKLDALACLTNICHVINIPFLLPVAVR